MLFIMVVSLYTSRVILRELGVENYGIYNVIGGFVTLFSILSNSLSSAISRFFTFELGRKDKERLQIVFSSSISIMLLLAFIIFILLEVIGVWAVENMLVIPVERMDAAHFVLQTSIIAFLINLITSSYRAAIIAYERMAAFAYFGIVEVLFNLGIAFSIQIIDFDSLKVYSCLRLLLVVIIFITYFVYGNVKLDGCKFKILFDKDIYKSLGKYAGWSVFGIVAYTGYTQGYNILLNVFFGPVVNAARGIAVQVQTAIQSFSGNFQASLNPQIIKSYATNNRKRMFDLIFASSKYSFYLMLLLSLPIILETEFILNLWLTEVPDHTVNFIRLLLIIVTFDVVSGPLIIAQNSTGDIKIFQIVAGSVMILSLPVCYVFFKLGACPETLYVVQFIFTVLTHICRIVITCTAIGMSKWIYLKCVFGSMLKVFVPGIILPIIVLLFSPNNWFGFLSVCFASAISVLLSVFIIGLGREEKKFVIQKIVLLKNKYK